MKTLTFFVTVATAGSCVAQTPTPTPSFETRLTALEQKVDDLEKRLSIKMSQPQKAESSGSAVTTQEPGDLIHGAILEVWPLKPGFQGDVPPGVSAGAAVDRGEYFRLSNFLAVESLRGFAGSRLGFRWSGFVKVTNSGEHALVVELNTDDPGNRMEWAVFVRMAGQPVITARKTFRLYSEDKSAVFSESLKLEPGYYPLEVFTYLGEGTASTLYKSLRITARLRSASSPMSAPFDARSIFHRE